VTQPDAWYGVLKIETISLRQVSLQKSNDGALFLANRYISIWYKRILFFWPGFCLVFQLYQ